MKQHGCRRACCRPASYATWVPWYERDVPLLLVVLTALAAIGLAGWGLRVLP